MGEIGGYFGQRAGGKCRSLLSVHVADCGVGGPGFKSLRGMISGMAAMPIPCDGILVVQGTHFCH